MRKNTAMYGQSYLPAVKEKKPCGTLSMNPERPPTLSRHRKGRVNTTARMTKNWMKSQTSVALSPPRKVYRTMIAPETAMAQSSGNPMPTPTTVPMARSLRALSRSCMGSPSQARDLHMDGV